MVELIKKKREIPRKSYLISFDDGFENNYSIAAPILDYFKLNATFYFSTDFVQNNSMSWIDKIEYCFEKNIDLKRIYLDKLGQFDISSLQKKKLALDQIRKIVKKNYPQNIDVFVKNFFDIFKIKYIETSNSDIDKKLSWEKVKKLSKNKYFTIGGHSHNHMPFTYYKINEAKKQIITSINLFKLKAGINLKHYSYPEGQKSDFNNKIISILKKNKIECCPTAIEGKNNQKSNLFRLNRFQIY